MRKQPNPNPPKRAVRPTPPPAPPLREFKTAFLSELVETSKSKKDTEQWRNKMENKSVPKAVLWGWRVIGKNYPDLNDMSSFGIWEDDIQKKVDNLNNGIAGIIYEKIKVTITLEEI